MEPIKVVCPVCGNLTDQDICPVDGNKVPAPPAEPEPTQHPAEA